jgi:hypothetical protein
LLSRPLISAKDRERTFGIGKLPGCRFRHRDK